MINSNKDVAPVLRQINATQVDSQEQALTYFGGCDYLRLAWHPDVRAAVASGIEEWGLNVAASRLTTGNHPAYQCVEEKLAEFFGVERALVVSTGYAANLIAAQALAGQFSHVFLDARGHPSLADAAVLLKPANLVRFAHRDASDLCAAVARIPAGSKLVVMTDGVFTHDGSIAPLAEYRAALPVDAWLWVDDCHGTGTLGPRGRGVPACCGLGSEQLIHTTTLSKAFGCYGGVILGTGKLIDTIIRGSPMHLGSTPPPLAYLRGALAALELLGREPDRILRLQSHVAQVRQPLRASGRIDGSAMGPCIGITPRDLEDHERMTHRLLENRIYPSFVRYGGGPDSGYLRLAVSSEHKEEELRLLIEALTP